MSSFTAENNACGQTLLHLVARGSAIIAELLRLSTNVPAVFFLNNKRDVDRSEQFLSRVVVNFRVHVCARSHFIILDFIALWRPVDLRLDP